MVLTDGADHFLGEADTAIRDPRFAVVDPVALDAQVEKVVVAGLAKTDPELIDLCPLSRCGY